MGIPIIPIIPITGITLMATFRSIMISMSFIISIMTVALVVVSLAVVLMVVTTVVVMAGEGTLDRLTKAGAFRSCFFFTYLCKKQAVDDQEKDLASSDDPTVF